MQEMNWSRLPTRRALWAWTFAVCFYHNRQHSCQSEGLFLLCKKSAYIVDNYFKRSEDEIVDVQNVGKSVRSRRAIITKRPN